MADLSKKVVVVTGGGRGIGKQMALAFADAGAKVVVASRSEGSCGAVADEINAKHEGMAKAFAVDVSDAESVDGFAKAVLAEFGAVNVLVNNAGVTRDGLMMRMKAEDWDTVLDTNLKGAFLTVKAFQRSLMKAEDPRIINVSSVIGLIGNAGQANYAASKAGLIGFTKSVARELAGRKVTCNAIAPGFISTDMTDELSDAVKEGVVGNIPLGDFGQPQEVADLALYLASPAARYITGQVVAIDGGMTM